MLVLLLLFSGFLQYKTQYSYFNRNGTTVTNGIIDLFKKMFPRNKRNIQTESMLNTTQWHLVLIEHLQELLLHIFLCFFSITTLPREAVTNCTLGLASAKKKNKTKKHLAYIYINIHFHFICDQNAPSSTPWPSRVKKPSRLSFLLLRCFLFITIHLSSSTNLLPA